MSTPRTARASATVRGLLFVLVGLVLAVGGAFEIRSGPNFERGALRAVGTVVRLNAGPSHPQVRFTTPRGQTVEYPQGGLIFNYQPGQRVAMLYDPDRPQHATLDTFGARWGFTTLGLLASLVFVVAGLTSIPRREAG